MQQAHDEHAEMARRVREVKADDNFAKLMRDLSEAVEYLEATEKYHKTCDTDRAFYYKNSPLHKRKE